jgi:hypothetical protein
VGVALLTRLAGLSDKTTLVNRSDLWGSRSAKYESLASGSTLAKVLLPASPYYFFKYWDETNSADYMNGYALPEILRTNSSGIVTSKDHFVVSLEKASLIKRIKEFAVSHEVGDALLQRFDLSENYAWSATKARDEVAKLASLADFVRKIAYRPFDNRFMFYHPSLVWRTREEVMQHMDGACLSLISCRQQSQEDVEWSLAGVTKLPIESCVISNKTKEINYSFPLWLTAGKSKVPNLSSSYLAAIHAALNLASTDYRPEDHQPHCTPRKSSTTSTPCCTARPTASATPRFCAPTSRASPSPAAARCSTRSPNWVRSWWPGIFWSTKML